MENLKTRALQLMKIACPGFDLHNKSLGELPWGSLDWANYISSLLSSCPEDYQQKLLRKLFVDHQLQNLSWNAFLDILEDQK